MIASVIIGTLIFALLVFDLRYIYRQRKTGSCIGCSSANSRCSCNGSCRHGKNMTKEEIRMAAEKIVATRNSKIYKK